VVGVDGEWIVVRVAVDASRRVVVVGTDGGLAAVESSPIIAGLAEEWRADVTLEQGQTVLARSARGGRRGRTSARGAVEDVPVAVLVVGGIVPIDPERRRGLAAQLECSLSVLPAGDMHLVQTHGEAQMDWPSAQRPVVRLTKTAVALTVEVYSRAALDDEPAEARWAMRGIPDLTLSWRTRWEPVLTGVGEIAEVQRMMGRADVTSRTFRGERDPQPALAELGADAAALDTLREHPNDDTLLGAVVSTLALPTQTTTLLRGRAVIDDLPGAQHIERTSMGRAVWDQTHSTGASFWTRVIRRLRGSRPADDEGPGDRGRAGPS